MGQYNKAVLTTAGENLIARALAGEIKLSITKAKTSDFAYPDDADLKRLTDMQGVRQTVCDLETAIHNETIIQTRVLFSNEDIASTYYIHNIGLYAMDGTHEVLFSIVTAEIPDEMPQYNGVASTSYIYNIQNVVQDAPQLNISVNPSGTATIQDVLERVDATGGDISETVIETLDTVEDKYPIPASGESVKRFFGKVLTFLRNIRPLTQDTNIYVSTTGSDITGDGTSAKPYRTIQHAIDIVPKNLNGYAVTINVASGSYPEIVTIAAFHSGTLFLSSDTKDTIIDTCRVSTIKVRYSSARIYINGFNCTDVNNHVVNVNNCCCVNVSYCQSIVTTSKDGIYYGASSGYVLECKIANRASALYVNAGMVHSSSWNAGSINNTTALISINGAIISKYGIQPSGTNAEWQSSGQIINQNGTQISDITNSGLTCTWGTIRSAGYARHGNLMNGVAQVIVDFSLVVNTQLTAGQIYYITGFPIPLNQGGVALSCTTPSHFRYCALYGQGYIEVTPAINILSGYIYSFSAVYLTNV